MGANCQYRVRQWGSNDLRSEVRPPRVRGQWAVNNYVIRWPQTLCRDNHVQEVRDQKQLNQFGIWSVSTLSGPQSPKYFGEIIIKFLSSSGKSVLSKAQTVLFTDLSSIKYS